MQSVQLISLVFVFLVPNVKYEAPRQIQAEIHLDTDETGGLISVWLMTVQPLHVMCG